jgi:hypothetical protein
MTKLFKIQFLKHYSTKIFQISYIKSNLLMSFQNYHNHTQIPL